MAPDFEDSDPDAPQNKNTSLSRSRSRTAVSRKALGKRKVIDLNEDSSATEDSDTEKSRAPLNIVSDSNGLRIRALLKPSMLTSACTNYNRHHKPQLHLQRERSRTNLMSEIILLPQKRLQVHQNLIWKLSTGRCKMSTNPGNPHRKIGQLWKTLKTRDGSGTLSQWWLAQASCPAPPAMGNARSGRTALSSSQITHLKLENSIGII